MRHNVKRPIIIDFLYLDLTVCRRCQSTESVLLGVLSELSDQLKNEGFEVTLNSINVNSIELATHYQFLSSPTIRVNGQDIAAKLVETVCEDCGSLCGDSVSCRDWVYQGKQYTSPPIEMVREAILDALYSPSDVVVGPYQLPDNLRNFFDKRTTSLDSYPKIKLNHL